MEAVRRGNLEGRRTAVPLLTRGGRLMEGCIKFHRPRALTRRQPAGPILPVRDTKAPHLAGPEPQNLGSLTLPQPPTQHATDDFDPIQLSSAQCDKSHPAVVAQPEVPDRTFLLRTFALGLYNS